jgi:hypothetical protein
MKAHIEFGRAGRFNAENLGTAAGWQRAPLKSRGAYLQFGRRQLRVDSFAPAKRFCLSESFTAGGNIWSRLAEPDKRVDLLLDKAPAKLGCDGVGARTAQQSQDSTPLLETLEKLNLSD